MHRRSPRWRRCASRSSTRTRLEPDNGGPCGKPVCSVVAYHHLAGRDKKTRVQRGACPRRRRRRRRGVAGLDQLAVGETVPASASRLVPQGYPRSPGEQGREDPGAEKQTLEVCKIAKLAMNGADFAAGLRRRTRTARPSSRRHLRRGGCARAQTRRAARGEEKELKEAENADRAQGGKDAANSRADAKKEINEAKAASTSTTPRSGAQRQAGDADQAEGGGAADD